MHRSITNAMSKNTIGKKVFYVEGTLRTIDGPQLDICTEYAFTIEEAWAQAENHAAGTAFTPEKIEERKW
jgi:hypothetical protein